MKLGSGLAGTTHEDIGEHGARYLVACVLCTILLGVIVAG
jgi:hypothetical protein